MTKGKLWGVGVGPGDPQLMTLKAVEVVRQCDAIAVPRRDKHECLALSIALGAVPELADKPTIEVHMPMTKDPAALEKGFQEGTAALREALDEGRTVAFLTLGDPTVYSTYSYLHTRIKALGYDTQIVPGITSFCAAAAALDRSLCQGREDLHIIPATYGVEEALSYPGVKVLMKNNVGETRKALVGRGLHVQMAENCGLPQERLYRSLEEIPEDSGYYSLIIVKEEEK